MNSYRYKDEDPKQTVKNIKCILEKNNIQVIEEIINPVKDMYSVILTINKTNLTVNGKGVNKELTLASAYGELMERIQNFIIYKNPFIYDENSKENYYNYPDEVYVDLSYVKGCSYIKQLKEEYGTEKIDNLIDYLYLNDEKIAMTYFYNVIDNEKELIPSKFLYFYGTNGMSAGNSESEALVEGICEIFERYSMKCIIKNKLILPTISKSFVSKYNLISETIEKIEHDDENLIIIKDCSINGILPVVGIICINKLTKNYIIKLGAHPIFSIALERCFTELLQGRDLESLKYTVPFTFKKLNIDFNKNFNQLILNNLGYYSPSIFLGDVKEVDYKFENQTFKSNYDMKNYLFEICRKMNKKVYYKNVSFLGFPSYRVVIPTISEVLEPLIEVIKLKEDHECVQEIILNINNVSNKDIEKVNQYIESNYYSGKDTIADLFYSPFKDNHFYKKVNIELFKSLMNYRMGDYNKSSECLNNFIKNIKVINDSDRQYKEYYACCKNYIDGKCRGYDTDMIKNVLTNFFNKNLVEKVCTDLEDPNDIFNNLQDSNLCNLRICYKCKVNKNCYYGNIKKMYDKFKAIYSEWSKKDEILY